MPVAADRYYRASGTVPFVGTVTMMGLGCIGAVVFSFLYSLILNYVPYDKIMFLAAMGVGFGTGGFVRAGALVGGATSRLFSAVVAVACGLMACYLTWVWDIWMLNRWDLDDLSLNPLSVLGFLIANNADGLWQNSPTGIWLWLLWLSEVLMITGIAIGIAVIEFRPYCHECNKWTEELPAKSALPRSELSEFRANLEEERYEVLDQLAQAEIDPASYYALSLMKCPNCDDSDYLTVTEVDVTANKKGELSEKRNEVIRRLHVTEEVVDQVVALASRQQALTVKDLDFGSGTAEEIDPEVLLDEPG